MQERGAYMRRIEFKVCRKCGKTYLRERGGIVATPADFVDSGMCTACKMKASGKVLMHIVDIVRGKVGHG